MKTTPRFVLTLYVSICDEATGKQIQNLRAALAEHFKNETWTLNLVEVIDTPEKAVANDIFTTPTLVREMPKPVVKVLDGLTKIPQMLSVITQLAPQ